MPRFSASFYGISETEGATWVRSVARRLIGAQEKIGARQIIQLTLPKEGSKEEAVKNGDLKSSAGWDGCASASGSVCLWDTQAPGTRRNSARDSVV